MPAMERNEGNFYGFSGKLLLRTLWRLRWHYNKGEFGAGFGGRRRSRQYVGATEMKMTKTLQSSGWRGFIAQEKNLERSMERTSAECTQLNLWLGLRSHGVVYFVMIPSL